YGPVDLWPKGRHPGRYPREDRHDGSKGIRRPDQGSDQGLAGVRREQVRRRVSNQARHVLRAIRSLRHETHTSKRRWGTTSASLWGRTIMDRVWIAAVMSRPGRRPSWAGR